MRRNISLFSLATIAIAATLSTSHSAQAQLSGSVSLTAEVSSLRNKLGQVCFSLFNSSKGFPNDSTSIVETKCVSAQSGAALPETEDPSATTQNVETQTTEAQTTETRTTEAQITEAQTTEETEDAVSDSAASDTAVSDSAVSDTTISVTFESLPLGTYAVSVFHDENEDGQINQGGFGIPLEGFGFSQNPSITTRAPEFSETAIIVVGAETKTEIELIYY